VIPKKFTCDAQTSPRNWNGMNRLQIPRALPSSWMIRRPPGTWVHWVLYDVPADERNLQSGCRGRTACQRRAAGPK